MRNVRVMRAPSNDNAGMPSRPSLPTLLVSAVLVAACGRSATPPATAIGGFCKLSVAGNRVALASGQPIILLGESLPSLAEMARAGESPADRMRALAASGARLVSLAIDDTELTPLYFPESLAPVLRAANDAGVIVILSYRIRLETANRGATNPEIDNAEDFLKLALGYVNSAPGVWFDPIQEIKEIAPVRRRNVAQRMVDIIRGSRADNIIVVRQPEWFRESDPALNAPLQGGNVVYALGAGDLGAGMPMDRFPFLRALQIPPDEGVSLGLSAPGIATVDPAWARAWKSAPAPTLRPCA